MRTLLVFLLVGCGPARSAALTKCQLKTHLEQGMEQLEDSHLGDPLKIQANIVCYVALSSEFNTSSVDVVTVHGAAWTLYGVFRLSDHLICSDGKTPSLNKCRKNCTDLLDGDISDDVGCLLEVLNDFINEGFAAAHWEDMRIMARPFLLHPACRGVHANQLFSECLEEN